MRILFNYIPVVEEILVTRITEYLEKDCKWAENFPKYPVIKIDNEYPWVPFMNDGWPNLNEINETLFPAVTIVNTQDNSNPEYLMDITNESLDKAEFDSFKKLSEKDGYLIAPEALTQMEAYFEDNDVLYGTKITYRIKDTIAIDITTDDPSNIKNRIYDLIRLYLTGQGRNDLLDETGIEIDAKKVQGTRSGAYNIDFGKVLKGSSFNIEVNYPVYQVYYDTSEQEKEVVINHTTGEN